MKNSEQNPTTDNQGVKSDSVQGNDNPSVDSTNNDNKTVDSIPYARFNEVTKQKKDLETKIRDYEAKQEENRVKRLEEQVAGQLFVSVPMRSPIISPMIL